MKKRGRGKGREKGLVPGRERREGEGDKQGRGVSLREAEWSIEEVGLEKKGIKEREEGGKGQNVK